MHSAVAHGWVDHQRLTPAEHRFRYRISMLHLDLGEAPELFRRRWLWSWNRPNLACVLRRDHLRGGDPDLITAVRDEIERQSGERPAGPVTLLTQPRYWGYCMNPISFYFVWSADRRRPEWLLLEVHNTPWNEQHPYVLKLPADMGGPLDLRFDKAMHVSPFMDMNMQYRLRMKLRAGEQIQINLENWREQQRLFGARMSLRFAPVTAASLAGLLVKTPFMSFKVAAAIYFEALRLKLKAVPYVPHPGKSRGHASPHPSGVAK